MFGFFLILVIILIIFFIGWHILAYHKDWEGGQIVSMIFGIFGSLILIGMFISIPIERLDSKRKVAYFKTLQTTLDHHRNTDMSSFERFKVMEDINKANFIIADWKTKGNDWYYNKWILDESTTTVNYIK